LSSGHNKLGTDAIGVSELNVNKRTEEFSHTLTYNQKAFRVEELKNLHDL